MLRAANRAAVRGLASTSSFPTNTFPASSLAMTAIVGATIRHGPHQSAHISSKTGRGEVSTTEAKFASVTMTGSDDGAGSADLHFPQTGCFSSAASKLTRFFVPQVGHGTTKLFAGAAINTIVQRRMTPRLVLSKIKLSHSVIARPFPNAAAQREYCQPRVEA